MPTQELPTRAGLLVTSLVFITTFAACAGDHPLCGRGILDALARDSIPVPDDSGRAFSSDSVERLPADGPITLADLFRVAQAHNPDLAAARSAAGAAAGHAWQASHYPNPRAELSTEDFSWRNGSADTRTSIGVTQPIILGDRREAAADAARAEQRARLAEVETRRRTLLGEIAVVYSHLIASRDEQRLHVELRELVNKTLVAAQTRFEARAAPETDVIRPRIELHRIDAALARLREHIRAKANELGVLVHGVSIDPARLDGAAPPLLDDRDFARFEAAVRTSHPSLKVADAQVQAAEVRFLLIKAELTPDVDVRIGVGYNAEIGSGVVDVGVGMTLPLWDRREGDALSARFDLMRARQERLSVESALARRLAAAAGEYAAARVELNTFRDKIVPDAQRSFDQTSEGYRAGRATFLDLLDAQRTFTDARVSLTQLARAVAEARAQIIQIVGPDEFRPHTGALSAIPTTVPSPIHMRPHGAEDSP